MTNSFCHLKFSNELRSEIAKSATQNNKELISSINYCTTPHGKYLRPQLVFAIGNILSINEENLLPIALAIEMIHLYSLIHDDLPCMDDDDYRRGKLSCHKVFNEATAILAGNSLQAMAFETIALSTKISNKQKINTIIELAKLTGAQGLLNGQFIDLNNKNYNKEILFELKTGSLFKAAILLPLNITEKSVDTRVIKSLNNFANTIGVAYQWYDDSIDNKCAISKAKCLELKTIAIESINNLPNNTNLKNCIDLIIPAKEISPSL